MRKKFFILICLTLFLTACKDQSGNHPEDAGLVVYCPHPVAFISPLVEEFESRTGIAVEVVQGGTGELLNVLEESTGVDGAVPGKADTNSEELPADIFWGGSLSTMKPHMYLFEDYQSVNEEHVNPEYRNIEGALTRFTDVPSVLMINTDLIGNIVINGYEDLLQPELKGKIAFADPSKASSSYEHLINMLYAMGNGNPELGWDYVEDLCDNLDGTLLGGSSEVYNGVADGKYVAGLTFEEGALNFVTAGKPVSIVYMEEGVIFKPDGVYIVKQCEHMENARLFVDFITGRDAQTTIANKLNRRSVRDDVPDSVNILPKSQINIIYDDEKVVLEMKTEWLKHFKEIFDAVTQ